MVIERKKYDKSFKTKAVELSFARNNVNEVAEELDIKLNNYPYEETIP